MWVVIMFSMLVYGTLLFVGVKASKTPFFPRNHNKPIEKARVYG